MADAFTAASASNHILVMALSDLPPITHLEVSSTTCSTPAARRSREKLGRGEGAEQEHPVDVDERRHQRLPVAEIDGHHLDASGLRHRALAPGRGAHGDATAHEVSDELTTDVARRTGDQDHDGSSSVLTSVSPPVTSRTVPVT